MQQLIFQIQIRTEDQKESMKRQYLDLQPDLMEAQKLAISYGDVHLVTRISLLSFLSLVLSLFYFWLLPLLSFMLYFIIIIFDSFYVLELLANIYRRSDLYEQEVGTIERAVKVSRTSITRGEGGEGMVILIFLTSSLSSTLFLISLVPKVMALLDAMQRMIDFLFAKHSDNADVILKYHTQYLIIFIINIYILYLIFIFFCYILL